MIMRDRIGETALVGEGNQGDHYYSESPRAVHRRREVVLDLHGITLSLVTDSGVFSRDSVDPGSLLLLKSVRGPDQGRILDIGCGYGPIGLYYAAKCPDCEVHLSDINERAVELSGENARRNCLSNVVVHKGDAFLPLAGLVFDLIVTNPPIRAGRQLLLRMFAEAHAHLVPGGRLAFVARTQQGAKTLARELLGVFGNVADAGRGGGYRVYEAAREAAG